MRLTRATKLILALAIFAVIGGLLYQNYGNNHPPVAAIVADALAGKRSISYVAEARTNMVYCGKKMASPVRIIHAGNREKLIRIDCAARPPAWSMTLASASYTYLPNKNTLLVSRTNPSISAGNRVRLLLENYRARYAGSANVAGRPTVLIDLIPRQDGRPSRRIWVDWHKGVVMRSVDYSSRGEELSSMQITRINYRASILSDTFRLPSDKTIKVVETCKPATRKDMAGALGFSVTSPSYLPVGYKLEGKHVFVSQCNCTHRSALLTYTDGLNVISIFESPPIADKDQCCQMDGAYKGKCIMRGCEMAPTGRVMKSDKMIVVVGDLLPAEIERIAGSVK